MFLNFIEHKSWWSFILYIFLWMFTMQPLVTTLLMTKWPLFFTNIFYCCDLIYGFHPTRARSWKKKKKVCVLGEIVTSDKGSARYGPGPKWPTVYVSLNVHSCMYCLWLLLHKTGRVKEWQQRSYGPQNLIYLLFGPSKAMFADPCFRLFLRTALYSSLQSW